MKKRRKIQRTINHANPDSIFFSEAKTESFSSSLIRQLWGRNDVAWIEAPAVGASGGMVLLWDKNKIEILDFLIGGYTISARCRFLEKDMEGIITGVYGPNNAGERKLFLREIYDTKGLWDLPWVIGGDFNIIRSHEKHEKF